MASAKGDRPYRCDGIRKKGDRNGEGVEPVVAPVKISGFRTSVYGGEKGEIAKCRQW